MYIFVISSPISKAILHFCKVFHVPPACPYNNSILSPSPLSSIDLQPHFCSLPLTPQPPVTQIRNYTLADLTNMYEKYKETNYILYILYIIYNIYIIYIIYIIQLRSYLNKKVAAPGLENRD